MLIVRSTYLTHSGSSEADIEGLDPGIAEAVRLLMAAGVETFESCQGGLGHAFPEPTVRFFGHREEGFRALAVALRGGLRVSALRRYWAVIDGEPTGPHWELVLVPGGPADRQD
jgi:hypothetical protein